MSQNKSRLTAIALICMLTVSFASCNKKNEDDSATKVVTDIKHNQVTTVPAVTYPETDDNGNKITMVEVTDESGKKVTDAKGSVVTQVGVLNQSGLLVTDKNGALVTPSINVKPHTAAANSAAPVTVSGNKEDENIIKVSSGPTVRILSADESDDITGKAGEEIVVKLSTDSNPGYSGLTSWIDINTDIFEIVKCEPGDPTLPDYKRSKAKSGSSINQFKKSDNASLYIANSNKTDNYTTILCLYFDSKLEKLTEKTTLATITLKIKDDVKAGEYDLGFDSIQDKGNSQCNYVDDAKQIVSATPKFIDAKVKVQ